MSDKTITVGPYTIVMKNLRNAGFFNELSFDGISRSLERLLSDEEEHLFEYDGSKWIIDHATAIYNVESEFKITLFEQGEVIVDGEGHETYVSSPTYDAFTIKRKGVMKMSYKLEWDKIGERYYENGVSHGVLYPQKANGTYDNGVVWNGLTNVTNSPEGAEPNDLWADNIKYASLRSAETFSGSIEAYTYPAEFRTCIGMKEAADGVYFGQQAHEPFGFCYRTEIGNDTPTESDAAYKIHLVYGATVTPSEESFDTINDSPDAITFSWDFDTIPIIVDGFKPVAHIVIDSRDADPTTLAALTDILDGTAAVEAVAADVEHNIAAQDAVPAVEARLPLPDEVITLMTVTT